MRACLVQIGWLIGTGAETGDSRERALGEFASRCPQWPRPTRAMHSACWECNDGRASDGGCMVDEVKAAEAVVRIRQGISDAQARWQRARRRWLPSFRTTGHAMPPREIWGGDSRQTCKWMVVFVRPAFACSISRLESRTRAAGRGAVGCIVKAFSATDLN